MNVSDSIHEILKKHWGYDSFRPKQEEIIRSVLEGNDTLALLPTGGGKSICFQVPAIAKEGICIVVSPLIALMKDQVYNLKKHGVNAISLTSGMTRRAIDIALDNCIYGTVKFLYVSPERLKTELFTERLKKMNVGMIAVDEAHCISQWGYDFRPPYLEIAKIKELIPNVPTIALTASATDIVCNDIQEKLTFDPAKRKVFRQSFGRANLHYKTTYSENKKGDLLQLIHQHPGSGIVYVRSRHKTQEVSKLLQKAGISAQFYHAGLNGEERSKRQENWILNKTQLIVATNAFGMGIDKPDVRLVVHLDIPPDLESYYQEAGRAGRDEKLAHTVLLYDHTDIKNLQERFVQQHPPIEQIRHVYQALANHFRISIGSGELEGYSLDLDAFCKKYNLKKIETFYAIKKLENQGLLELNDAFSNSSKIYFRMDRRELYQFQVQNPKVDVLIQLLLRMYGGEMSTHYVAINESHLARELKAKVEDVRATLTLLQSMDVLEYEEQTRNPKIILLTPRHDAKRLPINQKIILHQKELATKKISSIVNYTQNTRRCRTLMILEYFDEIRNIDCGNCDFCLRSNSNSIDEKNDSETMSLEGKILSFIQTNSPDKNELKKAFLNYQREDLTTALRALMDTGQIKVNTDRKWTSTQS